MIRLRQFKQRKQLLISYGALILCAIILVIGFYFIFSPRDQANEEFFLVGILLALLYPGTQTCLSFVIIYTIGLFKKNMIIIASSVIPLISYIVFLFASDYTLISFVSFSCRTLDAVGLPILLICAILIWHRDIKASNISSSVVSIFIATMLIVNIYNDMDWRNFRSSFKEIINTGHGYIEIENTKLKNNPSKSRWNNTELGLIWSEQPIKAIITNKYRWIPFDPHKTLVLMQYLKYDNFFINSLNETHKNN